MKLSRFFICKSEKKLQNIYPSSSSLLALSHHISLTVKSLGRDVLYHLSATGKTQRQTETFGGAVELNDFPVTSEAEWQSQIHKFP